MSRYYSITPDSKLQFAGLYLLRYMDENHHDFNTALTDAEADLQPVFEWLIQIDYVTVDDKNNYAISGKGRDILNNFKERFEEFLSDCDIFCAVDLESGEFAFERYHHLPDRDSWTTYISEERFDDLRVAVAEHRNLDPIEIVFMSFVQDGLFGTDGTYWSEELLTGDIWENILAIVNTAVKVQDLGFVDNGETISGITVIEDIIEQARTIASSLAKGN